MLKTYIPFRRNLYTFCDALCTTWGGGADGHRPFNATARFVLPPLCQPAIGIREGFHPRRYGVGTSVTRIEAALLRVNGAFRMRHNRQVPPVGTGQSRDALGGSVRIVGIFVMRIAGGYVIGIERIVEFEATFAVGAPYALGIVRRSATACGDCACPYFQTSHCLGR